MRLSPTIAAQLKFEQSSPTLLYLGEASPGASTSSASWRIMRIDTSSGVHITYADNVGTFDKIWDNRASYTYG